MQCPFFVFCHRPVLTNKKDVNFSFFSVVVFVHDAAGGKTKQNKKKDHLHEQAMGFAAATAWKSVFAPFIHIPEGGVCMYIYRYL
jgi:hypothetical protein